MMKKCKRCGTTKPLDEFTSSTQYKDGHVSECKPCKVAYVRGHYRSAAGRISYIYLTQKKSSVERGHPPPTYTKKELMSWATEHGLDVLMAGWKAGDYAKDLAPSVDRQDPHKPYSLCNIRLVPWKDNNSKAYEDRKSCRHITAQNRRVRQMALDGSLIAEFGSISNASRTTGITRININDVCRGKAHCKTAGGFLWEYIN